MQRAHAFEPQVKASIDVESFIAADHFLRRIDRVLDLSFVRELTAPRYAAQQGRPSWRRPVFAVWVAECVKNSSAREARQ